MKKVSDMISRHIIDALEVIETLRYMYDNGSWSMPTVWIDIKLILVDLSGPLNFYEYQQPISSIWSSVWMNADKNRLHKL